MKKIYFFEKSSEQTMCVECLLLGFVGCKPDISLISSSPFVCYAIGE